MTPGRIVVLNGAPRSGKSSIAAAIQGRVPGDWVNLGVDAFNRTMPEHLRPGIGLRPGGERPDLEGSVHGRGSHLAQHNLDVIRSQMALFGGESASSAAA